MQLHNQASVLGCCAGSRITTGHEQLYATPPIARAIAIFGLGVAMFKRYEPWFAERT